MDKLLNAKVDYIGRDQFVKFTNTQDFSMLTEPLRQFLSTTGVYNNPKAVPFLSTSGQLTKIGKGLIVFGTNDVGYQFCIDTEHENKIVYFYPKKDRIGQVNSSFENYINCLYVMRYFSREIEDKNVFGDHYTNYKRYAHKLLTMFNEVEGDIKAYPIWYLQVTEREVGIL